jgi:hypothetical protein
MRLGGGGQRRWFEGDYRRVYESIDYMIRNVMACIVGGGGEVCVAPRGETVSLGCLNKRIKIFSCTRGE